MLTFKCPHCQQEIETEDENVGQEATCPNCSKSIVIPFPETSSEPEENKSTEPSSAATSGHWKLKKTEKEIPTVQTESGEAPIVTPIPVPPDKQFSKSKPSNLSMATTALSLGIVSFFVPVCGLGALILGIIALIKINRSNGMLLGKGKAIIGVIFGCLSTIWLILTFVVLKPAAIKAKEKAQEISCTSNLKQIGLAYVMYIGDHDNCIPNSIEEIQKYIGPGKLTCPAVDTSTSYSSNNGYVLLSVEQYVTQSAGKKKKKLRISDFRTPSDTPIVICPKHNTFDIIGYMDGHVEKKPKQGIPQP